MRVLKWLLDAAYDDERLYADLNTKFGRTRVYDTQDASGSELRVLDVEGSWQSGSYRGERWSELAFAYHRSFETVIFDRGVSVSRILMLGGGALSYPKHTLTHHEDVRVDVVEVDPDIILLARRYFFLNRLSAAQAARLHIICDDGAHALASCVHAKRSYDVIINDAFAAYEAPKELTGRTAAAYAHAILAPNGLYVANVVSALQGQDSAALAAVTAALSTAFAWVRIVALGADDPTTPDNNVVVASNVAHRIAGALAPEALFG